MGDPASIRFDDSATAASRCDSRLESLIPVCSRSDRQFLLRSFDDLQNHCSQLWMLNARIGRDHISSIDTDTQ